MPYRDVARQRQAQRESARRRALARKGMSLPERPSEQRSPLQPSSDVSVAHSASQPAAVPEAVTLEEIYETAKILHMARGTSETLDEFRERIRAQWRLILKVVG